MSTTVDKSTTELVLVCPSTGRDGSIYHLPSKEDARQPACGRDVERQWYLKDPKIYPTWRVCKNCTYRAPDELLAAHTAITGSDDERHPLEERNRRDK